MRLTNNEVDTIARAMADKMNTQSNAEIKRLKADPKIEKDAKTLFATYKKLPKFFTTGEGKLNFGWSTKVTLEEIKSKLFDQRHGAKIKKEYRTSEFEQEVRLTAIESKDMAELKSKLSVKI